MLKVAIENGYNIRYTAFDEFGARFFMQKIFHEYGIELVRVSINRFNEKKQCFDEYNIIDWNGNNILIKKPYIPDIIRIRKWTGIKHKYETLKNFTIVPSEKVAHIGDDKFENYRFTKKHQPTTFLLSWFFNNSSIQKQFSDTIVLKPIRSNWGKWIILTTTKELLQNKKRYRWLDELYIVQQFKDFGKWCPEICTGNHDIRLMFAWNKIIEITLRIPKKWDFRSNIWSWGKQIPLQKKQLPKELLLLSKKIYKELKLDGNDILSMDFANCKQEKNGIYWRSMHLQEHGIIR
jgi:glutathione synthase/RimK-type ligase-like ATP-grasp enzyme